MPNVYGKLIEDFIHCFLEWKWQKMSWDCKQNSKKPLNRRGHTCVFYPSENKLIVYGGVFGYGNFLKDMISITYDPSVKKLHIY